MRINVQEAFLNAMWKAGLRPNEVIGDGRIHRCGVEGKEDGQDGAYQLHLDGIPNGWFENHRAGVRGTWKAEFPIALSATEREELTQKRRARERQQQAAHKNAARVAANLIRTLAACPTRHPYLQRKGISALGRISLNEQGNIVIPIFAGQDYEIASLQLIDYYGRKKFLQGGKLQGNFFHLSGDKRTILICEGYATGATLHLATGLEVICAMTASNLIHVARRIRRQHPTTCIVICGDDDHETSKNPGRRSAIRAATAVSGIAIFPKFLDPAGRTDFNDMHGEQGIDSVRDYLKDQGVLS